MSIVNLEKTFENRQLVYCNLDNKIFECICLSKLSKHIEIDYDNKDFGIFNCSKVRIITIYDIYKNIISEPIETDLFKDSIKIGMILENLKKDIYFFKTFMGVFIKDNKLNGIQYHTSYKGTIYKILYNNISLEISNYIKTFNIYDDERKCTHEFQYKKDHIIYYINDNNIITYNICNNHIEIRKGEYPFYQTIYCHTKNLKIFKIVKYYGHIEYNSDSIEYIYEQRNDNNEITSLIYYDNTSEIKEIFSSNDINPSFSKPLRKFCIELNEYYKENINNYIEIMKFLFKKEKEMYNKLSLNCKLEIINSK